MESISEQTIKLLAEANDRDRTDAGSGTEWLEESLGRAIYEVEGTAGAQLTTLGKGDLIWRGRRLLHRFQREVHSILCGDTAEDEADRKSLKIDNTSLISAVTTALTVGLAVSAGPAAIIAALLVKVGIAPTLDAFCVYWGKKLND